MGWHAPAGTAASLRELFAQFSSPVVARPVGAVPEHGRPVILKTAEASAGSRVRPGRERRRTYVESSTVIEAHGHPVHPQTILPAGSRTGSSVPRRRDFGTPGTGGYGAATWGFESVGKGPFACDGRRSRVGWCSPMRGASSYRGVAGRRTRRCRSSRSGSRRHRLTICEARRTFPGGDSPFGQPGRCRGGTARGNRCAVQQSESDAQGGGRSPRSPLRR